MVEWHYRLNGHEFEQAMGDGGGQRSLATGAHGGLKESDTTQQLISNKQQHMLWETVKNTTSASSARQFSIQQQEGASLRQRRACCDHVYWDPLTCS